MAPIGPPLAAGELAVMRAELVHPGPMLKAVKEGFARRLNLQTDASGHVWESRYHDVAVIDAGGVLACLVYVDLNPFRAGLVKEPVASEFCSAGHRRMIDRRWMRPWGVGCTAWTVACCSMMPARSWDCGHGMPPQSLN